MTWTCTACGSVRSNSEAFVCPACLSGDMHGVRASTTDEKRVLQLEKVREGRTDMERAEQAVVVQLSLATMQAARALADDEGSRWLSLDSKERMRLTDKAAQLMAGTIAGLALGARRLRQ